MLTSDLLVTKTYKGKIEPVYARIDKNNLEVAESLINIFQKHIGRTYGELAEEIDGIEEIDFRFIRGLSQILKRKCVIEMDASIEPSIARKMVFEECGGSVLDIAEREEVITKIAEKVSLDPNELEKDMWADMEENLIVKDFHVISPEDLLKQYNMSLTQTLLFKATGMEIQINDNFQEIFWNIKKFGLMYSIEDDTIYLDGAASLFKMTERYGNSLAKLLPTIMRSKKWSIKASVLKKTMNGNRIYDFTLDSGHPIFEIEHDMKSGMDTDMESFDSAIEKEFSLLNFNDWNVRRESEVLKAGQYAFIPDFSLEKNGKKVYVEIIGFWTPEYLKKKIHKINLLEKEEKDNLILLVNKKLACSGSDFNMDNVIFYDRKVPYLEIINILRKFEEKMVAEDIERLKSIDINFEGNVIDLDEIAEKYNVTLDALSSALNLNNNSKTKIKNNDHLRIGNQLVNNKTLKAVEEELNGVNLYNEALIIIEKYGIKGQQIFDMLGYKVKWNGLDPDNAELIAFNTRNELNYNTNKSKVYVFKVALKYLKGTWRRIEVQGDQTLEDFDGAIKEGFNYDDQEVGEFFSGTFLKVNSMGIIEPDGSGTGVTKKIEELELMEGSTLKYIYGFGDDIEHFIKLEKIVRPIPNIKYPRIISRNKKNNRYCVSCKEIQIKSLATLICIDCTEEKRKQMFLCQYCMDEEHEDHYVNKLIP